MTNIILIIFLAVFVALTSILSSTGEILDRRKNGLKSVTKKGWVIFVINFGIIFLSVIQYYQNEMELEKKDKESAKKQTQRDSALRIYYDSSLYVMKQKYDDGHIAVVKTIASALGKYGYKLDSSNQKLIKLIRDSSKTRVILPNDPVLAVFHENGIQLIDHKNGKDFYKISFYSADAGSSNFDLKCSFVLADSVEKLFYKGTIADILPLDLNIPQNNNYERSFQITDELPYTFLYVFIKGNYKNLDATKSFKINDLYYYNKKGNTFGLMLGKTKLRITDFIDKMNIN